MAPGYKLGIVAVAAFAVGAAVGGAVAFSWTMRTNAKMAAMIHSQYTWAVLCYGPPSEAATVAAEHLAILPRMEFRASTAAQERTFVLASLAMAQERVGQTAEAERSLKGAADACHEAGFSDCSRTRLKHLADMACRKDDAPADEHQAKDSGR